MFQSPFQLIELSSRWRRFESKNRANSQTSLLRIVRQIYVARQYGPAAARPIHKLTQKPNESRKSRFHLSAVLYCKAIVYIKISIVFPGEVFSKTRVLLICLITTKCAAGCDYAPRYIFNVSSKRDALPFRCITISLL